MGKFRMIQENESSLQHAGIQRIEDSGSVGKTRENRLLLVLKELVERGAEGEFWSGTGSVCRFREVFQILGDDGSEIRHGRRMG